MVSNIYVEFSEDGLIGNSEIANINIPESIESFRDQLFDRLCKEYPDAGIEVKYGINDYHNATLFNEDTRSFDLGRDDPDLGEIIHDVWESWKWVVEK